MKVWEFSISDLDFTTYHFPDENDREYISLLAEEYLAEGKPVKDKWRPLILLKKEQKIDPDFFDVDDLGVIIISSIAAKWIKSILRENDYELLPLINDDDEYFVFNPLLKIDCLDSSDLECHKLPNNQIIDYEYLTFDTDKVESEMIFRVPELPYNLFVSGLFEFEYKEKKLHGLNFTDDEIMFAD